MLLRGGVATLAALLLLAAPAPAAPSLVEVARFSRPVAVSSPPGDPRLFVVEQQTGRIEVVLPDGTLLPDAFLDLGAETPPTATSAACSTSPSRPTTPAAGGSTCS